MPNASKITPEALARLRALAEGHMSQACESHGPAHILETERLALRFLPEGADSGLCSAIALLHDADDGKLFPESKGRTLNAERLLRKAGVDAAVSACVTGELLRFGYSRRLQGLSPQTAEGMAASDADMCTLLGASGILRLAAHDAQAGVKFFDPEDRPNPSLSYESYTAFRGDTGARHMLDKVLRLPGLMLTKKGRAEAYLRRDICVQFLAALFAEQGAPEWEGYLENFLAWGDPYGQGQHPQEE